MLKTKSKVTVGLEARGLGLVGKNSPVSSLQLLASFSGNLQRDSGVLEQPTMQHGPITIRRGKRTDLPELVSLLAFPQAQDTDRKHAQHWRRLASDPAHDFYVAEQQDSLQGMVLVSYVRTLVQLGWLAILDLAIISTAQHDVSLELIDFAKTRARKRGCQHLIVYTCTNKQHLPLTTLLETGFLRIGEVLSYPLQQTS